MLTVIADVDALTAPAISARLPKLVAAPRGTEVLVPVLVILPEARGVPEDGLTWMFEKDTWQMVEPSLASLELIV